MVHIKRIVVLGFVMCLISCHSNRNNNIKLQFPYLFNTDFIANNGSIIYCDTNYVIRKISTASNDINWEFNLERKMEFLKIENIDKYLFIGGNTKNNYSYWLIEINDGSIITKNTFDFDTYHKPLFIENKLYFINSDSQIIKCNINSNICDVVSVEGIEPRVPNNLVKYKDKLYTSHDGNLVEINIETLEISNITPLNIKFQGVIDFNFLVKGNIIIPSDNEIIIFDLDSNKLKCRYSATDIFNNNLDYYCGIIAHKNTIITKSMNGYIQIYDIDNLNDVKLLETDDAPILCDNSIEVIDKYILNSNYSNVELYNIETLEKLKTIKEKKTSSFVKSDNSILFINMENELCKIDLKEID